MNTENLRLFNITVSVSDHGTPPHSSVRQAQVSILLFTPLKSTLILIETTDTTMTVRFNLKYVALSNIAKYGIIVQEYVEGDSNCEYFIVYLLLATGDPVKIYTVHTNRSLVFNAFPRSSRGRIKRVS